MRGSTPSPGAAFTRYGGHTSCVAISRDGRSPTLVLDAGTGIRRLSALLDGAPFKGSILLGHLHWDHTQGLPFFEAGDHPEADVRLVIPAQGEPLEVMRRFMSPPHFPIDPSELHGRWRFASLEPGSHDIEGFTVLALDIPHKGGRTFGFRVSDADRAVAYLSDHGPIALGAGPDGLGPYHEAALALADGVDLLVHDAQYTAEELAARPDFGHSAAKYAVCLAERAGAGRVLLFHHDPNRTDDQVDDLVAALAGGPVPVSAAAEGMTIDL